MLLGEQFFALGFRLLTRGDVRGDATNGVSPPTLVAEWELDRNDVVRPIDRDDSLFELKRHVGRNYFLIVGAYCVRDLFDVYVVIGLTFYFGIRHAVQNLIPAVDPQVTALKVFDIDGCEGLVEDGAQLRLAPAQLLFGSPALGHVAQRGGEIRHFAALVAHRPDMPFEINFRAILAVIDRLAVEDLARHTILAQLADYGAIGFRAL